MTNNIAKIAAAAAKRTSKAVGITNDTKSERSVLLDNVTSATITMDKSDETLKNAVIAAGWDQSDVADAYRKGMFLRAKYGNFTKITKAMLTAADTWRTASHKERSEEDQKLYKHFNTKWSRLLASWDIKSTGKGAGNSNRTGKSGTAEDKAEGSTEVKAKHLPTAKSPTVVAEYFHLQCAAWIAYAEKNKDHVSANQLKVLKAATKKVLAAFPKEDASAETDTEE